MPLTQEHSRNKEGLVAVYFKVRMVTVLALLQEKCGRPKVCCGARRLRASEEVRASAAAVGQGP